MENYNINSMDPVEEKSYNRKQNLQQYDDPNHDLGQGLHSTDVAFFLETKDITVKQEPLFEDEETESTSAAVKKNMEEERELSVVGEVISSERASRGTVNSIKVEGDTRLQTSTSHSSDESCPPQSVCKVNFNCSECPFQTTEEGLLEEHWRTHSSQIGLSDLLQSFVSNSEVFTGKVDDKVDVKRFNCNLHFNCHFKTNDKQLFDAHCKEHSEDNKKYRCGHCSYKTRFPGSLNLHLIRHTDEKRYQCSHCHFSTPINCVYLKHVKLHSDKPHLHCTKCDYKTRIKSYMNAHMLAHAGIYRFTCSECDFKAHRKLVFKAHVLSHFGEKLYKCSICDYSTNQLSQLRFHKLDHDGVKKFKCSQCDYQTNRKYNLNTHAFIHKPTKRFKCSICDHETNRKYNLKVHIRKQHSKSKRHSKENTSKIEGPGDTARIEKRNGVGKLRNICKMTGKEGAKSKEKESHSTS